MLLPRLAWEGLLLLLAIVVAGVLMASTSFSLGLSFWYPFASTGLLATGFALSVRVGAPNLAVAGTAALSSVTYAKLVQEDWPAILAGAVVVVLAVIIGLVLGAITGVLKAPAWAVSLGGLALLTGIALALSDARGIPLVGAQRPGGFSAALWTLLFVVTSIGGGLLFLVPKVRSFVGEHRVVGSLAGFVGSSVLAALSGVVLTSYLGISFFSGDVSRLFVALAIALLAGVSLAGNGRGPIAGTVLATALVVLLNTWLAVEGFDQFWAFGVLPGLAILIGVAVGSGFDLLDRIMAPKPQPQPQPQPATPPDAGVTG